MHQGEIAVHIVPVRARLSCRKWNQKWSWVCFAMMLFEAFVSFSSDTFSQFIFKLSGKLSKIISTFLNQHLQFVFTKIRVQNKAKTVSDFTACNNLIGPGTNIAGDS